MTTPVRPLRRLSRHPAVRQGSWAIVGQLASSMGNLLLLVIVARQGTVMEFGVFALVTAFYFVALTGARAAISTPLLMACAGTGEDRVALEVKGSLGACILVALLLSVPAAITGFLIGDLAGQLIVILASAMPFLLLQDSVRYGLIAGGRSAWSAACDVLWLALQVISVLMLVSFSALDIAAATAAWGAAGGVAGIAGLLVLRQAVSLPGGWQFLVKHRRMLPTLMGDYVAVNLVTQAMPYAIALTAGLAAAGALRAGLVLLGLVNILILALTPIAQIEATKLHKRAPYRDNQFVIVWTVVVGGISLTYGALLVAIPDALGRAILGNTWTETASLLLALALYLVARSPYNAAQISLYARLRLREAFYMRLISAPGMLILPAAGAVVAGAEGAAYGLAMAGLFGSIYGLWTTSRIPLSERDSTQSRVATVDAAPFRETNIGLPPYAAD